MPITLEKYAEQLDKRGEPRPAPPEPDAVKAKPKLPSLDIKAVLFEAYGVLLSIAGGEPYLLNPDPAMKKIALDKTIREFNMWASMSRKPGEPSAYMEEMILQIRDKLLASEIVAKLGQLTIDAVWLGVVQRLKQKDYIYPEATLGEPVALSHKIAYYYVRSSQGYCCFPKELDTLRALSKKKVLLGTHARGQVFTPVQIWRELTTQGTIESFSELFDERLCLWTHTMGAKKDSERGLAILVKAVKEVGLEPSNVLIVGTDAAADVEPVKRRGFRTALLLADRAAMRVTADQLKDDKTKPDALLTDFQQLLQVVGG